MVSVKKVTLGMFYRFTNLYSKYILHVREIEFFVFFILQKPTYVVFGGKAVILVKCSFRHNTSPACSKNWWDARLTFVRQ